MTLDLEPITEPTPKLDLEPVSGASNNLDLEPITPASPKSSTPATDQALAETPVVAPTSPATALLDQSGTNYRPEDSARGIDLPESLQKPLRSVGQTAKGFVTGFPQMVADTARFAQGTPSERLEVITKGALQTAAQMKTVKTTEPFSQEWWNAVVPLAAQEAGAVAGVRGSAPELAKPPMQGGELNAVKNSEATQVHGDVQQPEITTESAGQMPADVNSQGVQARGQGNVVEGTPQETNVVEPQFQVKATPTGPELVQHGEFAQEGYTAISDEPQLSSIANRFVKERAVRGEIGEVSPGQGFSTVELAERGLKMSPEEVNQHVSDIMQGGGDPVLQASAIRGEEARLRQRSDQLSKVAETKPSDVQAQLDADNAFKDLTDFHKGPVAQLKQNWANQGRLMQGEIPVDLSTLNGLREQWLRDTGEAPPTKVEPTLRRTVQNVSRAVTEENGARTKLAQEIDKHASKGKLSADEVRDNIRERMGLEPCKV